MWTDAQWDVFAGLLDRGWPGELADGDEAAYRTLLSDAPPEAVIGGLKRLLYRGQRFRPSAAELLAAAREDPSLPTFAEAYTLMFGGQGIVVCPERDSQVHPLVVSFVQRHGRDRLRMLPVHDPDWGEKHRRDLERDWKAHIEAMEGRETAALAAGGDPRQLDPMCALTGMNGYPDGVPALGPGHETGRQVAQASGGDRREPAES